MDANTPRVVRARNHLVESCTSTTKQQDDFYSGTPAGMDMADGRHESSSEGAKSNRRQKGLCWDEFRRAEEPKQLARNV